MTSSSFRLAVCEAPADLDPSAPVWTNFARTVRSERADVVLLNEMPFGSWLAAAPQADVALLELSSRFHDSGIAKLGDLGTPTVIGSRPVLEGTRYVNEGFVWEKGASYRAVHTKQFFPEEEGYYESSWYSRGDSSFEVAQVGALFLGMLICTDLMFNEWARHYRRVGANLIVVPRATPAPSTRRWRTALSMAAIVSGCYVASSNRAGTDAKGQEFGAHGWIVDPYGDVIAETSADHPVASAWIDFERVKTAQLEYPCYVSELPTAAT